jgi:hypothetical protein
MENSPGRELMAMKAALLEYQKLKEEQTQRIHFRDNLRYVNLVAAAVVASYASSKPDHAQAWLLIPWLCSVLGWTYVMHKAQVKRISNYIETELSPRVGEGSFGWDPFMRRGHYGPRKAFEALVDQVTFVAPSAVALYFFCAGHTTRGGWRWLVVTEAVLAAWVALWICVCGRQPGSGKGISVRFRASAQQPQAAAAG